MNMQQEFPLDSDSPLAEKNIFEKYNIHPKKHFGQNFLINTSIISNLIDAAKIDKEDTVVEVGAGTGLITKELAKRAGQIYAVEKDERLISILKKELAEFDNVEIIHGDILKFNPSTYNLKPNTYKLIGAPPYYLTARLFRKFLEEIEVKPQLIALIIQKEVAQKITARPPKSNKLAVSVQLYGEPKIIQIVSKTSFWPRPEVDSALLLVKNIKDPSDIDEKMFFRIVGAGFSAPRKQLVVNLSRVFHVSRQDAARWLEVTGIEATRRAQTLEIAEWMSLSSSRNSAVTPKAQ